MTATSKLIFSAICSLDGYVADRYGDYSWGVPDEAALAAINEQARAVDTYLYGRRIYETMVGWENDPSAAAQSTESAEFAAIWQRARKVVFSSTLAKVSTKNTQLERELTVDVVSRLRSESTGDLYVDGPNLAASAFRIGAVDEVHLIIAPVVLGGGKPWYPQDIRLELAAHSQRCYPNGMVQLHYQICPKSMSA